MSTHETVAAGTLDRGRANKIRLWARQVLLAGFFVLLALVKLSSTERFVEIYDELGFGQWLRYAVGGLELAGGVGLLVARLSGLAALGLSVVTLGAVFTQLFAFDAKLLVIPPAILTVVLVLVARERSPETRSVLGRLRLGPFTESPRNTASGRVWTMSIIAVVLGLAIVFLYVAVANPGPGMHG
jgi:uncharacterized membrane protein